MSFEAELPFNLTGCAGCVVDAPPPDSILLIPPPPLPSFLQISPLLADSSGNATSDALYFRHEDDVLNQIVPPCSPHCDWSNSPGVEYIELSRKGSVPLDDTWFLVVVGSSVAVLLLGALLAFILLKCRSGQSRKNQADTGGGACRASNKIRTRPLAANLASLGSARCSPNQHALWAAITQKGTPAHFVVTPSQERKNCSAADACRPAAPGLGYYGALDHRFPGNTHDDKISEPGTPESQIYAEIPDLKYLDKLSTFENTAFEDYMYEDMPVESFPMSEVPHVTLRHAPPREIHYASGSLSRFGRPLVSPPTNIESPNLPPLNLRNRNPLLV